VIARSAGLRLRLERLVLAVVLAGVTTLQAGCSLSLDATTLGVPATLASSASAPAEGTKFHISGRGYYGLWGVVKLSQPSLKKTLATQLGGGTSVADIRIKIHSGMSDLLITVLTLGLVVPRTVTVEGVVVGP